MEGWMELHTVALFPDESFEELDARRGELSSFNSVRVSRLQGLLRDSVIGGLFNVKFFSPFFCF